MFSAALCSCLLHFTWMTSKTWAVCCKGNEWVLGSATAISELRSAFLQLLTHSGVPVLIWSTCMARQFAMQDTVWCQLRSCCGAAACHAHLIGVLRSLPRDLCCSRKKNIVFFAAQLMGRGGVSVLILMALGESTSIFQNGWYMARDLRKDSRVRPLPASKHSRFR